MKPNFDQILPALEPPHDFMDRVLARADASHNDFADRVLARADEPRVTIERSPTAGQTRRLAALVWIMASAAMLVFGLVGFWSQNHQREARIASERALLRGQQSQAAELARLKAEVEAARVKEEQLRAALASAKYEMERSRLQLEIHKAMAEESADSKIGTRVGTGKRTASGKPGAHKACDPNDPLCGF